MKEKSRVGSEVGRQSPWRHDDTKAWQHVAMIIKVI